MTNQNNNQKQIQTQTKWYENWTVTPENDNLDWLTSEEIESQHPKIKHILIPETCQNGKGVAYCGGAHKIIGPLNLNDKTLCKECLKIYRGMY